MGRPQKFDDTEVLHRATDLFWKQGSDAVSIRDLEVALELRAPSIYRRFRSKEELLVRCLDHYVDQQVGRRVRRLLDGAADPLEGIRAFFTSALTPHDSEPRLRGCLLTNTSTSVDAARPDVRCAIDRGLAAIEAAFRAQVERAIVAGRLAADTDPRATATALLLSFQGLLVLARSGANDLAAGIDVTLQALLPAPA